MPKIMLVFPNPLGTIPSGLTYVAKRFRRNGWDVRLHINTFDHFRTPGQIRREIIDPWSPDVVGLSYATFGVLAIYDLQRQLVEAGYDVIAGGPHPTSRPEEVLRGGAQLAFRGEGELCIDDYCAWHAAGKQPAGLADIRGASWLDADGSAVHNPLPDRIADLDALGAADYSFIENLDDFRLVDGRVKGINAVLCGRGCPFNCSFCSHKLWRRNARRSNDSILEEMTRQYEQHGVRGFMMRDETFTLHKDRIHDFCRKLIASKLPVSWFTGTRINCVDRPLLEAMKAANCSLLNYGVESANDETLRRINKGYTSADAYEVVRLTGEVGIEMSVNIMCGFPWETPRSVKRNMGFIRATQPFVSHFQLHGAVIPYPDTPMYEEYHVSAGFTDWWLRPRFQHVGLATYQNVPNPYSVSTYFQRNLFDDMYVAEDYFFRFSPGYKRAVARMGMLMGWNSVCAQTANPLRRRLKYTLGQVSQFVYGLSPQLEKRVVGQIARGNKVHKFRETAKFVKEEAVRKSA